MPYYEERNKKKMISREQKEAGSWNASKQKNWERTEKAKSSAEKLKSNEGDHQKPLAGQKPITAAEKLNQIDDALLREDHVLSDREKRELLAGRKQYLDEYLENQAAHDRRFMKIYQEYVRSMQTFSEKTKESGNECMV